MLCQNMVLKKLSSQFCKLQMADAAEVLEVINRKETVTYSALLPTTKIFRKALCADLKEISILLLQLKDLVWSIFIVPSKTFLNVLSPS